MFFLPSTLLLKNFIDDKTIDVDDQCVLVTRGRPRVRDRAGPQDTLRTHVARSHPSPGFREEDLA